MQGAGHIGVIGLGAMGLPMARKLLEAQFDVVGIDVSEEARRRFAAVGGAIATRHCEMPSDTAAVLIVVVTAEQVRDVLFGENGIAANLAPKTLVIMSATVSPLDVRDIAKRLAELGLCPVEAPVSGGVRRAERGDLSVIVTGDSRDVVRAQVFLRPISREVFNAGPEFGSACTIKLLNQMLCGVHLAAAAETVLLAERLGLNQELLYRVVTQSSGNSYMFADRATQMLHPPATTNSAVDIFLKDLRLALETAGNAGAPAFLTAAAEAIFAGASNAGLGTLNDSQIIRYLRGLAADPEIATARTHSDVGDLERGIHS